jgi:hypothetical protein
MVRSQKSIGGAVRPPLGNAPYQIGDRYFNASIVTNTIFLYSWQVSYPPLPPRRRGGWGGGGLGRLTISVITYEKWYKPPSIA